MEKGDTLTQNREEDKPVDLRVLRYFLAVARMQSISAAAEELHITQPTLSRQLMELEEELGAKLFDRGRKNRRVALTEAGKRLHRQAEEIVALADKTLRSFQAPQKEISGEIAIGGGETDAMRLVARAARALTREHPNIRYHLYSGNAEDVTERLDKGLLDFGILIEPVSLERYDYIQLPAADTWGLLMRRDHPLARKQVICPGDLLGVPLLVSRQRMVDNTFSGWLGQSVRCLRQVGTYNLIYNAARMVEEGVGCALALDKLVNTAGTELCFRPLTPKLESRLNLVWKKDPVFSQAAEAFLKKFQEMRPRESADRGGGERIGPKKA